MNTRGKKNERGASMVEYGLLLAAILVLTTALVGLKSATAEAFEDQGCDESKGYYCCPPKDITPAGKCP